MNRRGGRRWHRAVGHAATQPVAGQVLPAAAGRGALAARGACQGVHATPLWRPRMQQREGAWAWHAVPTCTPNLKQGRRAGAGAGAIAHAACPACSFGRVQTGRGGTCGQPLGAPPPPPHHEEQGLRVGHQGGRQRACQLVAAQHQGSQHRAGGHRGQAAGQVVRADVKQAQPGRQAACRARPKRGGGGGPAIGRGVWAAGSMQARAPGSSPPLPSPAKSPASPGSPVRLFWRAMRAFMLAGRAAGRHGVGDAHGWRRLGARE